jgi:hypothetical protein
MIAQLIVLLAILAVTMGAVVRMPMRKHSNSDFVKGILAKAQQKVGSKHMANFKGEGPVVIEDYQNSQYYGECVATATHGDIPGIYFPPAPAPGWCGCRRP